MSKTVIITGAGSGIGLASVLAFAKVGWNVVATVRNKDKAFAAGLPQHDAHVLVETLDVTKPEGVDQLIKRAEQHYGPVEVLINNAAFAPMGALELTPTDDMARVFDTNCLGPMRLMQAVVPGMRQRGRGRIINVSSMGGEFTTPFGGIYHASKYALESLSDALRVELAPFGIDVVVIQPGPAATDLADNAAGHLAAGAREPYAKRLANFAESTRKQMEKGRGMLSPDEVARTILKAAEASKPRTRYKVGAVANIMPRVRRILPDRTWDAMWNRMIPANDVPHERGNLPAPAS